MRAAYQPCPEPSPKRQLLAPLPLTVFLFFFFPLLFLFFFPLPCFESPQMNVLLAGREGLQIGAVIPPPGWWYHQCTVNRSFLLCSDKWLSELAGRAKTWACPRLPTNTLLYYTLLPAPYPLLALVGLGIYEIFCFAGTENLRLLLNWSMSEQSVGTQYPRERA